MLTNFKIVISFTNMVRVSSNIEQIGIEYPIELLNTQLRIKQKLTRDVESFVSKIAV